MDSGEDGERRDAQDAMRKTERAIQEKRARMIKDMTRKLDIDPELAEYLLRLEARIDKLEERLGASSS